MDLNNKTISLIVFFIVIVVILIITASYVSGSHLSGWLSPNIIDWLSNQ
ncbi:MAG: hypothetical protein LBM96_07530 [Methanobrevibacter sp.]|nr:hypothetical protein [Candidatus Methanoflexus mossambicus]